MNIQRQLERFYESIPSMGQIVVDPSDPISVNTLSILMEMRLHYTRNFFKQHTLLSYKPLFKQIYYV